MKLLKGFMAVALITTALIGSSFAVYTAGDQDNTSVADLKEVGYTSPKKLALTRAGVEAVYTPGSELDPARGPADPVKHAKAFFKGILDGTIARFDGADAGVKRGAFLTALDAAIAKAGTPALEVDVTAAGFNPSAAPVADKITAGVDALFALVAPVNPAVKLLRDAQALGLTKANDGTEVATLLSKVGTAEEGTALGSVAALRFGKGNLELQAAIDARRIKHETGKYSTLGLHGNDAGIGAFHDAKAKAYTAGKTSVPAITPAQQAAIKFANDVVGLYEFGILEDASIDAEAVKRDLGAGLPAILTAIQKLGTTISDLEGQVARLKRK